MNQIDKLCEKTKNKKAAALVSFKQLKYEEGYEILMNEILKNWN